jgi:hypothetical protein
LKRLDARLRGHDKEDRFTTSYEAMNFLVSPHRSVAVRKGPLLRDKEKSRKAKRGPVFPYLP